MEQIQLLLQLHLLYRQLIMNLKKSDVPILANCPETAFWKFSINPTNASATNGPNVFIDKSKINAIIKIKSPVPIIGLVTNLSILSSKVSSLCLIILFSTFEIYIINYTISFFYLVFLHYVYLIIL